jgi:hypothetical protein
VNHQFVDLSFVEKRRIDSSTAHDRDVFSFLLPQSFCERPAWFANEFRPAGAGDRGAPRENA